MLVSRYDRADIICMAAKVSLDVRLIDGAVRRPCATCKGSGRVVLFTSVSFCDCIPPDVRELLRALPPADQVHAAKMFSRGLWTLARPPATPASPSAQALIAAYAYPRSVPVP
jgi:hypothetical protein